MNQDYSHLYGSTGISAPPSGAGMAPPQPETPPKPFVMNSADADVPPPKPFTMSSADVLPPPPAPPQYVPPLPPPPPPKPKKPRQPFSPTSLLLIAGVAFLFLGGALVLRQTWDTLADSARAVILLLFSLLFFGANVVAEKTFKLPKTGLAFYILGCIYLPMAVAGIGVFKLFGEWFSFYGDGRALVSACVAACVSVSTFLGVRNYKHPFLAWMSLSAAAVTVFFLDLFACIQCIEDITWRNNTVGILYVLFVLLSLVGTEYLLRKAADSTFGKAALWYQYPLMLCTAFVLAMATASLEQLSLPVPAILALLLGVGFFYPRFERKTGHIGVPGAALCLMTFFGTLTRISVFSDVPTTTKAVFLATASACILLSTFWLPKLSDTLRNTAVAIGMVLAVPLALVGGIGGFFDGETVYLFLLYAMGALAVVFFLLAKKHPFTKDTSLCVVSAALVYLTILLGTEDGNAPLVTLLLVMQALLFIAQTLLSKRMWCFVLAGAAAAGMVVINVERSYLWIFWIGTVIALGGVIYAHIAKRQLLEKSFAWSFIASVITALSYTLYTIAELHFSVTAILVLAAITLLYLLETAAFPKHERVQGTQLYLEILGFISSVAACASVLADKKLGMGLEFLTLLMLGVFAASFTAKRMNLVAIPHLLMLHLTAHRLISGITEMQLAGWGLHFTHPDSAATLMQVGCYLLLLVVLAVMGRLLLPKFFDSTNDGLLRVDLPLLTGVLVIFSTVSTIQWYPSMLFCLLMCVYALTFVGRVDNRYIPSLLASLFGCLTLLFHNIEDPFGVLDKLSVLDIKTLPIILYLLPAHVFILTLLWILPERCKNGVHIARFVMYCVTMLTLLCASMYFNNVTDAIVLVVFSFLILVGSFFPKRLRWFTLGFSVLVIMTIRLTWSFWKSLHWGIYLLLAGILLIVIASLFEYSARYAREHPDAPKKKFTLFATWKW